MSEVNVETEKHELLIVGAGPAGLSAAIYTTRENIDTVLFDKGVIGGLAAITDWIDNYPGFKDGVSGLDLAGQLQSQAERFGADIRLGEILSIKDEGEYKKVDTSEGVIYARAILIATGSEHKTLGVKGEDQFYGRGVHYCATCDGAFYKDKRLVVVGGGNSAAQEAVFLTKFASSVELLARSDIKASDVLKKELENNPKISIKKGFVVDEIIGDKDPKDGGKVVSVAISDLSSKQQAKIETDGVFVFIGLKPQSQFVANSAIELDERGLIKTDENLQTSIKGVFCAGDVRHNSTMQIASAVGEGATAALKIREYLDNWQNNK